MPVTSIYLGIHQLNQIFHDDIHAIFMKIAMITETKQIQLQALALHHFHIRQVGDTDFRKIGLSCNRTQTGKFGTVKNVPNSRFRDVCSQRTPTLREHNPACTRSSPREGSIHLFFPLKLFFFIFMFSLSYLRKEILSPLRADRFTRVMKLYH